MSSQVFCFIMKEKGTSWAYATPGFGASLSATNLRQMRQLTGSTLCRSCSTCCFQVAWTDLQLVSRSLEADWVARVSWRHEQNQASAGGNTAAHDHLDISITQAGLTDGVCLHVQPSARTQTVRCHSLLHELTYLLRRPSRRGCSKQSAA